MPESSPAAPRLPGPVVDHEHPPRPAEAQSLLRECHAQFVSGVRDAVHASILGANDLFATNRQVGNAEVLDFRSRRGEWQKRFDAALDEYFTRRIAGQRRVGRRPDADNSADAVQMLSDFDQEMQTAIVTAVRDLHRAVKTEIDALDLRVGLLLAESPETGHDNPFGPTYVLDAMGSTSRAMFPNPMVWRPLMRRILTDATPAIVHVYVTLNRFLGDRHVLPDAKAELRARSALRPARDSELLPLFDRLMRGGDAPRDGATAFDRQLPAPPGGAGAGPSGREDVASAPGRGVAADSGAGVLFSPPVPAAVAAALHAAYAQLLAGWPAAPSTPGPVTTLPPGSAPWASAAQRVSATQAPVPLHAPGATMDLIAAIDLLQRFDPIEDGTRPGSPLSGIAGSQLPRNRIPAIREAIEGRIADPVDGTAIDVVALLFDFIFGDPSIPDSVRDAIGRLQVPIVKAALLDHGFFSDRRHPARRLLDHLATVAIGAKGDDGYAAEIEAVANGIVDEVCAEFTDDIAVFDRADASLQPIVEEERERTAAAIEDDVSAALAAEEDDADRSRMAALARDRLAGLEVPDAVREFIDSVWVDYLVSLSLAEGPEGENLHAALRTLDDLLWSVTADERAGRKARLGKMIPSLIRSLRSGCAAVGADAARTKDFFDAVYEIHMESLGTAAAPASPPAPAAASSAATAPARVDNPVVAPAAPPVAPAPLASVHDFVAEMVTGTWLAFHTADGVTEVRLSWISPQRTRYIFTSRARAHALVLTPGQLASELASGRTSLIVEPVPLFDRAVSAALDALAARNAAAAPGSAANAR